jgi:hypothetical protein
MAQRGRAPSGCRGRRTVCSPGVSFFRSLIIAAVAGALATPIAAHASSVSNADAHVQASSLAAREVVAPWPAIRDADTELRARQSSIVGTLLLSVVLNNLLAKVNETIQTAGTVAAGTAMLAGTTLNATIDNARVAFFKDLDKRIKNLNKATRDRIEQIQELVDKFSKNLHQNVEDITSSAQQIANSLPLSNKEPQVRDYTPDFVAGAAPGTVRVRVRGNFFYASRKKYEPTLVAGTLKLKPTEATTQRLSFEVPPAALPTGSPSAIVSTTLRLVVPYSRRFLLVFKRARRATFQVQLGIVPSSPGVLAYTPTVDVPQSSRNTLTSGTIKVDSDARDQTETALLGPLYAGGGCQLLTDTAQFVRIWSRGHENISWKWRWVNLTSAGALAEIAAIDHPWWDIYADGGLEGYIQVDQSCNYTIPVQQQPQALSLHWGDQTVINTAGTTGWKMVFSSFDGRTVEIGNQGYNERFLRVSCCTPEGDLTLQAPNLDDVRW